MFATGQDEVKSIEIDKYLREKRKDYAFLSEKEYMMHCIDASMYIHGKVHVNPLYDQNDKDYIKQKFEEDITHLYNILAAKNKLDLKQRKTETKEGIILRKARVVMKAFETA